MIDEIIKQLVLRLKVEPDDLNKIQENLSKQKDQLGKAVDLGNYKELEKIMKNVSGEFSKISAMMSTGVMGKMLSSMAGPAAAIGAAGYLVGSGLRMTGSYMQYAGQEKQVAIDYALNRAQTIFGEQQARMQMLYGGNVAGIRDLMRFGPQARQLAERRFAAEEEQKKGEFLQTSAKMTDLSLTSAAGNGGMKLGLGGAAVGGLSGLVSGFLTGTVLDLMQQFQRGAQATGLSHQQLSEFRKSKNAFIESQLRELSTAYAQMENPFARAMEDIIQPRVVGDVANMRNIGASGQSYFRGRSQATEAGVGPEQYIALRQRLMGQGFTTRSNENLANTANLNYQTNNLAGTYEERAAYTAAGAMYGGKNPFALQNRYSDAGTQLSMQTADVQQQMQSQTFTKGAFDFSEGITDAMRSGAMQVPGISEDQANAITKRLAGNMPGLTQQAGTIENQVMRSGVRGALKKAGFTGAKLVYAEQYFQGKSLQEINSLLSDEKTMRAVFGLSAAGSRNLRKSFTETNLKILQAEGIDKRTIDKMRSHKGHFSSSEEAEIAMRLPGSENKSPAELVAMGNAFIASTQGRKGKKGTGERINDDITQNVETAARAITKAQGTVDTDILNYMETQGGRIQTGKELTEAYIKQTPQERARLKEMAGKAKGDLNAPATDVDKAMSHFVTVINGAASAIENAFKHNMTVGGTG